MLIKIINVSGVSKTLTLKLTPKDTSGNEVASSAKYASATVSTDQQPIKSFTSSVSTTKTGEAVTLNWDAPDAQGVNLQIDCKEYVKATSPSYTGNLPCGKHIFTTALSATGNLTLNFTNQSMDEIPLMLTLFAAIGSGNYNGIHTSSLTLKIASDYVPDPAVNFFGASTTEAFSWEPVRFSWTTTNSKGINLTISCADGISATSSKNADILPCGKYAFSDADILIPVGNISLYFQNTGAISQNVNVTLTPAFKAKTGYDATKNKTIIVKIKPKAMSVPPSPIPQTISPPPALPTPAVEPAGIGTPTSMPSSSVGATKSIPTKTPVPVPKPALEPAELQTAEKSPEEIKVLEDILSPNAPAQAANKQSADIKKSQEISSKLIEEKVIDSLDFIVLNPSEKTYEVIGRRRMRFLFFIPVQVKINLVVDGKNGSIKSQKLPWWSFVLF